MRQDPAFAALQASDSLPGQAIDVVVLTTDVGLLTTLREASAAEHALWHAPSADAAVDCLVGGRCGILVADLDALRGDAVSFFQRLQAQFPELVLVATGRREEEGTVTALVGRGDVYRFLHKPVSPARARLFLVAATRRYSEIRDIEPIALTTVRTIAARRDLRGLTLAIAVVLAALIAYVVWHSRDVRLPALLPTPALTPSVEEQVAQKLARANIAYATGRLTEPRGDNALQYFSDVLALQPNQPEAVTGIERVIALLEIRFEQALQARNAPGAAAILMAIQQAQPQHPDLDALHSRLLGLSRSLHLPVRPTRPAARPAVRPAPAAAAPSPAPVDAHTATPAMGEFSSVGERASGNELAEGTAAARNDGAGTDEESTVNVDQEVLEQARREAELKRAIDAEIEAEAIMPLASGRESPPGAGPTGVDQATVHETSAPPRHPAALDQHTRANGHGRMDTHESGPDESGPHESGQDESGPDEPAE